MSSDTQFVIRPEEIPETGEIILRAGQVPLFLGEPGIGKSANMATLAERRMNGTGQLRSHRHRRASCVLRGQENRASATDQGHDGHPASAGAGAMGHR